MTSGKYKRTPEKLLSDYLHKAVNNKDGYDDKIKLIKYAERILKSIELSIITMQSIDITNDMSMMKTPLLELLQRKSLNKEIKKFSWEEVKMKKGVKKYDSSKIK